MISLFIALLGVLQKALEVWVLRETLKLKTIALDALERIEDESAETEKKVIALRADHRDSDADVLLRRTALRASLRQQYAAVLSVPATGSAVHADGAGKVGEPKGA